MNQSLLPNLPKELEPYRQAIANTIKPYLKIRPIPHSTHWWQSKFGGLPYLPQGWEYPKDSQGQYLQLLAQLNFAEIPHLEHFPTQGILQFYITGNDNGSNDMYGLNFTDQTDQNGFRVLYFPEVASEEKDLMTNFDFLQTTTFDYSPLAGEFALTFTTATAPISPVDAYLDESLPQLNEDLIEHYFHYFENAYWHNNPQHQIGGYPYFVQEDPRYMLNQEEKYLLLLQIDSDYHDSSQRYDICWGDAGIGNFFIQPSRLKALDFSKVLYNWDCS